MRLGITSPILGTAGLRLVTVKRRNMYIDFQYNSHACNHPPPRQRVAKLLGILFDLVR